MEVEEEKIKQTKWKRRSSSSSSSSKSSSCLINNLDDGCLMHIFSFLPPIPDRYNTALVCHRWLFLACHPRLWLRVERSVKDRLEEPGVFPDIETAVAAARPGDTILIAAGGRHLASNIQIKKRLCLIGGGELPDETTLFCSRASDSTISLSLNSEPQRSISFSSQLYAPPLNSGSWNRIFGLLIRKQDSAIMSFSFIHMSNNGCSRSKSQVKVQIFQTTPTSLSAREALSALELLSTCKLANLTVKAELGCCLLHRNGRLTIEGCVLQCESNPLDHLSCPIVSTASAQTVFPSSVKCSKDGVSVFRTRIEGGAKAVLTSGDLTLQRVRVIYARTSIFFWFDVEHQ